MASALRQAVYKDLRRRAIINLMKNPTVKALVVTVAFSLTGLLTLLYRAPQVPELLPQTIFYAVLVLNTFFSVRFYSALQPKNVSQFVIDAVLVAAYLALALSLGRPIPFAFAALCLFILAPQKYALMLGLIPNTALLRNKILIDLSGAMLSAAVLGATLAGYAFASALVFVILFTLANIYLLFIRPMYRL